MRIRDQNGAAAAVFPQKASVENERPV